ncbi:hypothetical protein NG796_05275 [Laspinema sp. A4]|uniref:hypothetical protein n=1 Tax=Laspinema sp. D2d TaxID=2953686 RepID=UPI0021BA3E1F|nr:hypothetical protein [Laspinema sp. D2d]MCT7982701.1 hypothetical protein [Laspinema sp. D2d]
MTITSETIKQDLDRLSDEQLRAVADFIAFLKFRDQRHRVNLNATQLASLATEFAEEDHTLAEAGMDDYVELLGQED